LTQSPACGSGAVRNSLLVATAVQRRISSSNVCPLLWLPEPAGVRQGSLPAPIGPAI